MLSGGVLLGVCSCTQSTSNHADSEEILTDQQNIEKVTEFKYLVQNTHLKTLQKKKYMPGSEQRGAVLEKTRKYPQDRQLPTSLKKPSNGPMSCQRPMAAKHGL